MVEENVEGEWQAWSEEEGGLMYQEDRGKGEEDTTINSGYS